MIRRPNRTYARSKNLHLNPYFWAHRFHVAGFPFKDGGFKTTDITHTASLDDVKVFSTDEIPNYNTKPSGLGWAAGGTGHGANLKWTGGPFGCLAADGDGSTTTYIRILNGSSAKNLVQTRPDFTFSCWFRRRSSGAFHCIYGDATSSGGVTGGLFCYNTNVLVWTTNVSGSWQTVTGVTTITNNIWHHAVVTRNAVTGLAKLYLDGRFEASASVGVDNRSGTCMLMGHPDSSDSVNASGFDGMVSMIGVWSTTFSDSQVAELYQRPLCWLNARPMNRTRKFIPAANGARSFGIFM